MVQTGQSESVTSLAFSPDGHYAVVAGGRAAVLWDVRSGKQLLQLTGHADRTWAVAYSPDGKYVLTGSFDHTARLWDATTGRELRRFVGHLDSVNAVAFSPDGKSVLTGSDDHSARLWDVATGKELRRFTSKLGPHVSPENGNDPADDHDDLSNVSAVAFSQNSDPALAGKYVITGTDSGVQLWDAATGKRLRDIAPRPQGPNAHGNIPWSIVCSPDGRWVGTAESASQTVQLWDLQTGKLAWSWSAFNAVGPYQVLAFSGNSQVLFVGGFPDQKQRTATALNVADGKELLEVPPGGGSPIAFSQDGLSLLTGGPRLEPSAAQLWDLKALTITQRLRGQNADLIALTASPDGKALFTLDNTAAEVWDTAGGTQTMRLLPGADQIPRAKSPDGKATLSSFSVGFDSRPGPVALLTDAPGNVHTLSGHRLPIGQLGFSADGRDAYTRSEDLVQVWEVSSGRLLQNFPTFFHEAQMDPPPQAGGADGEAILSPDGKWILYFYYTHDLDTAGMVAHLKDAKTGKEVHQLRGHTAEIISMAFSADSKYALTGSYDDTMRLWDLATGNLLQTYTGNTDIVMHVAFDGDPRYVISGSLDGVTTIWNRATGAAVVKLFSFRDGGWAVVDAQGRYDASDPDTSGALYWVTDNRRSIELGQLEKEYYTPGLLARALKGERLPDVTGMDTVALPPVLAVPQTYDPTAKQPLLLSLTNDGGGVGNVLVKVNDRLVATLTPTAPAAGATVTLPIDLSNAPFVACNNTPCDDVIRITAYDAANRIESQDAVAHYQPAAAAKGITTVATDRSGTLNAGRFYAIVVGTSTFGDPSLKLTFPAKDAQNFAAALKLGADRLYGAANVSIRLLTSEAATPDGLPTKANIRAAFDEVHKLAKPEDTLVVYLSGHGVMSPSDRDLYYYLTADARTFDVEKDPALKDVSTVSSTELLSWLREPVKTMPGKEVIILDTCAAGGASEALSQLTLQRDIPPDQRRAIEMLKDSTGTYILMGAAADAVSYEASKYGEGLLTYALLEGMRDGPFDDGSRLGVAQWFAHASERVPDLAVSIGGIQKPEIAAPKGRGFPVAMLTVDDRGKVPIALPKPQLLRVLVEDDNQDDPLNLRDPLRADLRALNDVQALSNGSKAPAAPLMYLDATDDDLPGALSPKLLYTVTGNTVSVRVRLVEDKKTVAEQTITGTAADPQALAKQLTAAIVALAVGLKP
jgi:WD40 repeat protein